MTRARISRWSSALLVAAALVACDEQPSGTGSPAASAAARPADPQLARLYGQTCKACHTSPGNGAPQAGDRQAWEPRVAQGMSTLIERTINGYKGMPPLGSCMDCSEADYERLIRFMAGMGDQS